jgi:hypothetical protein
MVATKERGNKDTNSMGKMMLLELRKFNHDPQFLSLVLRHHLPSNKQMTMSAGFGCGILLAVIDQYMSSL